ncbi:MAG: CHAD domain-containing protein, partial [Myxococcales bacterium]|nr:CHAD domain-containing protein [Myxococcales bacterium]
MSDPTSALLDLPVGLAARRVARSFLDEARAAAARLDDPDDPESLHDFRVAIRRQRATLRAWRKPLLP